MLTAVACRRMAERFVIGNSPAILRAHSAAPISTGEAGARCVSSAAMSHRSREMWTTGAILVLVVTVLSLGLTSGTGGVILIGVAAGLAIAVIVFRLSLQRAGMGAALLSSFTLTWNGWFVGPLRPGDALVLITLVCFVLARPNAAVRTPPWWVKQLALLVVLVAVLQVFFPPDPMYLAQRLVVNAGGQPVTTEITGLAGANLGVAFKFVVAVAAIPMAFVGAALVDRRAVRWLAQAFALGAALSGAAATVDHFGGNVGRLITGVPNVSNRQAGFTTHPNFLAAGLCLAIPIAFWMVLSRARRDQVLGLASLVFLFGGVYASGSRGGAVSAVFALGLSVVLQRRTRGYAPMIGGIGAIIAGVFVIFLPSLGTEILRVTRLSGNVTTEGSDTVRSWVFEQGVKDFHHAPIKGIGLQASTDASQVYLQELASGGLILFCAMSVYMLGAMHAAYRTMGRHPLAASILASLVVTLALNIFEADLTDRFYYVPAALLIALVQTAGDDGVGTGASDALSVPACAAPSG